MRLVRAGGDPPADAPALIQSAADERQAAGKDDARLFAIFLDEYHVTSGANTDRVRDALLRFVDHDLTPRDLVAVMKPLDSLFAIRLTRDRAAVRRAIETFDGRKGQYEPRNAYERDYIAGTPARIDATRSQVALSAVNALAVHLGSLADRRKTLVVATEAIGRSERRRGQEFLPTLDTIIRSANRANVAVYPVRPERRRGRPGGRGAAAPGGGNRRRGDSRRCGLRPAARGRRLERLLPAVVPLSAPGRREIPRAAGEREACRRARARAERLLGRVAGRGDAHGAAREDRRAEAGRAARAGAARQHADSPVVRGLARSRAARRA